MKLPLLFLIPEQYHHQLMFVCPTCRAQTFTPSTTALSTLRCSHCGDIHNAEAAEFEVLTPPAGPPPGHKPGAERPHTTYQFKRPR
jgi:hypothetical protein